MQNNLPYLIIKYLLQLIIVLKMPIKETLIGIIYCITAYLNSIISMIT
jgi:hypothetical protein